MGNFGGFRTVCVLTLLLSGGAPAFAQSYLIDEDAPRPPASIPNARYEVPPTRYERSPRVVYQQVPRIFYEEAARTPVERYPDVRDSEDNSVEPSTGELPAHLRRQVVSYPTRETPGTVVIDTPNTYLYYVLGGGQAVRYGIGVGREGFTWSGRRAIERKTEWPDWIPPTEMIDRQPDLPRWMAGGPGNPLGARAMYLAGTLYRIHGTSDPSSIGKRVSSGCIRMLNDDAIDLYNRAPVGTKVVVLPDTGRRLASAAAGERQSARAQRERPAGIDMDTPEIAYPAVTVFSPSRLY